MTPWLAAIGIGAEGLAGITPSARALIDAAETIVGGERHLALVRPGTAERLTWRTPLRDTIADILARRGRRVVVLASGDPMWFGVGVTLARHVPHEEMTVLPHLSAFNLAAARMAWPLAECACLTVHGRSIDLLAPHLAPGARLLVLSEDGATPAQLAAWLTARGWGMSRMTALVELDARDESRIDATAETWREARIGDLNTLAVACVAGPQAVALSRLSGLPDEVFRHDGQLTKREIRAATLAALSPKPDEFLWDIGAGSGSIAVEWLRSGPRMRAVAIEREESRIAFIAHNAAALGTPQLELRHATAPAALADLRRPDAIFIGGGVTIPGLIETCWNALAPGGRLAANVVTLQGESALAAAHQRFGGAMTRIAVSRLEPIGALQGWRAAMPVTMWSVVK
jgi:precorrin-6Y C5,15-methyltransferase (decarboxylating)